MQADRTAAGFSNSDSPVAIAISNGLQLQQGPSQPWLIAASWAAVIWYLIVTFVILVGWIRLQKNFSSRPKKSFSASLRPFQVSHVTIIRPVKDLEPCLYECLAASFRQEYPKDKLTIYLCIATKTDPAYATLKQLLEDFPDADARILVEEESDDGDRLGPNPKIRNMSRAYNEAKGDIVWIVDCNVWMGKGVCGRMVDSLCGIVAEDGSVGKQYRFAHQMPIAVDLGNGEPSMRSADESQDLLHQDYDSVSLPTAEMKSKGKPSFLATAGGRLEELFLSSSHSKFYSAINTIVIAPCAVGKSTMFRRSHLDYLTSPAVAKPRAQPRRPGIDYFSDNICEDHLIGDCLFQGKPPTREGERWGRHKLVYGDVAIQPVARMSVKDYIHRRIRWLRVRKFTVLLATLAEPGTESFLCSTYLAFGLSNLLPRFFPQYATYLGTWRAFFAFWSISIAFWVLIDWLLYVTLHSATALEVDEHTPSFALPHPRFAHAKTCRTRRPFHEWFLAWLGREALALPIWLCAFYGGSTVVWRDHTFRVGMDLVATKIPGKISQNDNETGALRGTKDGQKSGYGALSDSGGRSTNVRQRSPKTRGYEHRN
ncbi:ceramide glucosyltransferase, variant 2 [Blastomyces dermatitidis ATCC 18188]|uniref:Ceramide glucosyltransferase n=1 Tax=Ajellomyces dermatitidis (strain ATCC 18188 / CBS 674.68) TaxID=653446 RepID=F2TFK3_AJEDA|nr:ceramide glucosyltransferase [Blastomyces dermatitidis ATCC 18188]KMW67661.1 ceramide glucosyltransferase, variant 1 [Blastomyces dermatitidis ATCC 18188]KMW67662.1 ceramide glucosyltransferase, variant 2 [Blastomyces dermatitidis ATCC 18188]